MSEMTLEQRIEEMSGDLVLADLQDLSGLASLHTKFQEAAKLAIEADQPGVAGVLSSSSGLIENIILSDVADPQESLNVICQGLAAVQAVVRDGRPFVEAEIPVELGGKVRGETSGGGDEAGGPAVIYDEKILGDFLARQPSVLEDMEALVLDLERGAGPEVLAQLKRTVHTLKGESGLLGLADVERLCHTVEDTMTDAKAELLTDSLLEMKDWLARRFASLSGKCAAPEPVGQFMERLSLIAAKPAPVTEPVAPPPPTKRVEAAVAPSENRTLTGDPSLIGEFVNEANEHLENADVHLLTLESSPQEEEAMNAVFRAFHTIKGVAGFLALEDIQKLAHEAESLLDKARKGEVELSGRYIDLAFESVDTLKRMVKQVGDSLSNGAPLPVEEKFVPLVTRLKRAFELGFEPQPAPGLAPSPVVQPIGEILVESGAVDARSVEEALRQQSLPPAHEKLGELLVEEAIIARSQLDEALAIQRDIGQGRSLGDVLIEMGAVRQEDIDHALAKQQKPVPGKVGEILVKEGRVEAKEVVQALRTQQQQRAASAEVKEAVKVDADRLDRLIDCIGELVIAEAMVTQSREIMETASTPLMRHLNQLDKITRELQEMGMSLRMIPIRATFQKMARLVRDLAKKSGKKVEFRMTGEDTELDKSVVDRIGDPLVHMVRNSVDHGIEPSREDRLAAGKPETAIVELRAFHKGGSIYIEVQDDGRGLDREAILNKARERGLIRPEDNPSDREVWNLIFEPGFSTAKQVTDVSGRGVGMDVVRRNIEILRGQVDIHTVKGKGSTFSIRLPLTLAIIDGMVVRVGQERYIIPTLSVIRSIRPQRSELSTVINRGEMLKLHGQLLPLFRLHNLFRLSGAIEEPTEALVVVVEDDNRQLGLLVDELLGQQQIVIKSLGEAMRGVRGLSGGAIMSDGRVGLILDVGGLVRIANSVDGASVREEVSSPGAGTQ